jgi:hypothetical protein
MSVSSGGQTEVPANEAWHAGMGATAIGLATGPNPEKSDGARRAALHFAGSRSPPFPRIAEGPSSNVSQNAAAGRPHDAGAAPPDAGQSSAAAAEQDSAQHVITPNVAVVIATTRVRLIAP